MTPQIGFNGDTCGRVTRDMKRAYVCCTGGSNTLESMVSGSPTGEPFVEASRLAYVVGVPAGCQSPVMTKDVDARDRLVSCAQRVDLKLVLVPAGSIPIDVVLHFDLLDERPVEA